MNSKSKRHLRAPDRISGLSDALLWHILSFVETQDAVRTCILSTRWKNIWASVPTLDFDPSCFRYPSKFLAFVDHVLLLRYSSNIQKFRLHWEGINVDDYRIHAWIHAAIRRNVVELDLCAGYSDETRIFELPKSLVMCKTLVGSLPAYENLRQLKLVIQDCFCWELLTELLKRSPILESLVLECEVACCLQEGSDLDEGSEYEEGSEHEEGSDHEEGSEYEQGSNHEEGSEHQWNPPDCVPTCCLSHLKIVTIRGFTGKGDELEVAKYLLKYGQVLNKMTISMDRLDLNEKEKIYKEFLMVPRGSRTSIVEFI
ncbi:F-box/LRR-repeat protein At4g14103-like isoform X2 [Rosa rugosa]|uniref:F-box/LRR-repeat protein At4g14103-like isoform X2 n=1 Tax=Rosa rugosa TaxID=74645 RepID=UPI002B406ED2|nr:F-box/LRR-repeat protein At4g14103-like isoform X2 [Rosa rugosa]